MRKIFSFVLTALLLVQLGLPVWAVTTAEVAVSSGTAPVGSTVSLTVSVSADGVRSMLILPEFDGESLQLLSGQWLISGAMQDDWSAEDGDAVIAFENPTDLRGDVLKLTFKVLAEAQVSCDVVLHTNDGALEATVIPGQITLSGCAHVYGDQYHGDGAVYWQVCTLCGAMSETTPYTLGDVTGDGKVNMKDWSMLYNHISEVQSLNNLQLLRGDVTKDGKVNMKDWIRLYNHITEVDPL